jgi:uncharacterized protein (DUF2384 family)
MPEYAEYQDAIQCIRAKAALVLGSQDRAEEWMDHTSATLGGKPRDLAHTPDGTIAVLLHLAAISRHSLSD